MRRVRRASSWHHITVVSQHRVAWVVRRFHAHEKRLTASCRAWKREEARSSLPLLAWKREEADYFGRCVSILTPMHSSPSFSAIAALSDLHLILHPAQHSWLGLPPDTARLSVHVHSGTARGGLIQHVAHAVHSAGGRCAKGRCPAHGARSRLRVCCSLAYSVPARRPYWGPRSLAPAFFERWRVCGVAGLSECSAFRPRLEFFTSPREGGGSRLGVVPGTREMPSLGRLPTRRTRAVLRES